MSRTTGFAFVVLAIACGQKTPQQRALQYGAPQPPTAVEQNAAATAQTSLAGSLAFAPATDPASDLPGLPDQLVAALGGESIASAGAPSGFTALTSARDPAGSGARAAIDTTGIDPGCVSIAGTSVTWSGCVVRTTSTDPTTGDTVDMTVTVDGSMTWSSATGQTLWNVDETMAMTLTQGGSTAMAVNAVVGLDGNVTVTASTITGQASSDVSVTGTYMGVALDEALRTTLDLDLGYQADPFCITSGSMVLEQRWTRRPMGAPATSFPDQGWRFDWSGCGVYQVSHGS